MTLQYKFFAIPAIGTEDAGEDLNVFLRGVRLSHVRRELVCEDGRYYWLLSVEYTDGAAGDGRGGKNGGLSGKKIDYREIMTPEDFAVFAELRDWRKKVAARDGVQLFTVFINEQLAAMVERRVTSKAALKEIEGIGDGKVEKYGDEVLAILQKAFSFGAEAGGAAGGESVSRNSRAGKFA